MHRTPRVLLAVAIIWSQSVAAEALRGHLVFGHEARSFQACGESKAVGVVAHGRILERLRTRYAELAPASYDTVYAELDAVEVDEPAGAFVAQYGGVIRVEAVRALSADSPPDCGQPYVSAPDAGARSEPPRTYVFDCNHGETVTVRIEGRSAWLFLRQGTRRLWPVEVGNGPSWTDGEIQLELEDQAASISTLAGLTYSCLNDPSQARWEHAKLGGADFRAVGNEPGWTLEVRDQSRIVLTTAHGTEIVERSLAPPVVNASRRMTRWDGGDLVVEVLRLPCTDTMSGEAFDTRVAVYWRDRILHGCGRALH